MSQRCACHPEPARPASLPHCLHPAVCVPPSRDSAGYRGEPVEGSRHSLEGESEMPVRAQREATLGADPIPAVLVFVSRGVLSVSKGAVRHRQVAWLATAAILAVLVAWLAPGLAAQSSRTVHEASTTVRFEDSLGITERPNHTDRAPVADIGPVYLAGKELRVASADIRPPFSATLSDDGRAVTFRARSFDPSAAERSARAIARRFIDRRSELAAYTTPVSVVATDEVQIRRSSMRPATFIAALVLLAGAAGLGIIEWMRWHRSRVELVARATNSETTRPIDDVVHS